MRIFKDRLGRSWDLDINVNQVRAVKAAGIELNGAETVNLLNLVEDKCRRIGELLANPCALVDTLYVLLAAQAKAQGITDEEFGRSMAGEALQAAAQAFVEELADFFPDPAKRGALKRALQAVNLLTDKAMRELDKVTPEALADAVERHLRQQTSSTTSLTNAPESSAPIPASGPSAAS